MNIVGELTISSNVPDIPSGTILVLANPDKKRQVAITVTHERDGEISRIKIRSLTWWEHIKFFIKTKWEALWNLRKSIRYLLQKG